MYIGLDRFATGSGVPTLNRNDVHEFEIPIPPPDEQQAIAEALSEIDAQITALDELIAKKRELKQGAMQKLLTGEERLEGFSGEWVTKMLGECLSSSPKYGINAPAVPYSDLLPTYIRITDISDDGYFIPEKLVSVDHPNSESYFLEDGDLVFARTGASVGKSYLYKTSDGHLVFAGFLIRIKPNPSKLNPVFLANYVRTNHYWNWIAVMSMRSGQPGVNGNEYAQLPIPMPPTIAEQTAIAVLLTDMDTEIVEMKKQREKLIIFKQGMMQELLTGRTRLV